MTVFWESRFHKFGTANKDATEGQLSELKNKVREGNEYGEEEIEFFPIHKQNTTIIDMMCPSFKEACNQLNELCPDGNYDQDFAVTFKDENGGTKLLVKYGVLRTLYRYWADR